MFASVQCHNCSVVPTSRAAVPCGSLVWHQWSGYHCGICSVIWPWTYSFPVLRIVANVSRTIPWYHAGLVVDSDHRNRIFLFVGLVTIVTAPFVYIFLPNDIPSAKFLTEDEKAQAVERLRANQTGTGTREFKWSHTREILLEPKSYLWIGLSLLLNVGASVSNTFGPLILSGLGFDSYKTTLLNMPFGAFQFIIILLASYAAQKFRLKSVILVGLCLPVIAGLAVLYVVPRSGSHEAALLVAYYLLAFLFGANPIIVAWIVGNTAGTTKRSVIMSLYNAGSSAGNIIGPLLFDSNDAPGYHPGLRSVLAIFVTLVFITLIQVGNLMFLNRLQAKKRVKNGKQALIKDRSMDEKYHAVDEDEEILDEVGGSALGTEGGDVSHGRKKLGEQAFLDLTDRKNDEFVYIY